MACGDASVLRFLRFRSDVRRAQGAEKASGDSGSVSGRYFGAGEKNWMATGGLRRSKVSSVGLKSAEVSLLQLRLTAFMSWIIRSTRD